MTDLPLKKITISLLLVLFCYPFFLRLADFEARENDSRLYTRFVKQMVERPLGEIIAPEWRNSSPYADPNNPYIRDHLMGQFIPSTLLGKLGWDTRYVHYTVNQIYRFFIPLLIFAIFSYFFKKEEAMWTLIAAHFNPMALNYGMRANQEQALLFGFLLCLLGFLKLEKSYGKYFFVIGGTFGFLVKGLVGLIHFPLWGLLYLYYFLFKKTHKRELLWLLGLGLMLLITAGLYEIWFQKVTGHPFWRAYFEIQVFGRGGTSGKPFSSLFYYLPRTLGYAAPWSLGLILLWRKRRGLLLDSRQESPESKKKLMFIFLLGCIIFGYVFSLGYFSRKASRYIFPVYYLIAGLGALGIDGLISKLRTESKVFQLKQRINNFSPINLHLILFWMIIIAQYLLYLYKGKTYTI